MDKCMKSHWCYLPYPVLCRIFQFLSYGDVLSAGQVCKSWYEASLDNALWRDLFLKHFLVYGPISLATGRSWNKEFKRLCNKIPVLLTETLSDHKDQVLHISFSHDGQHFCTCSKDGCVILWTSNCPAKIKFTLDMTEFKWKHAQYSEFNISDTLLLVSGIYLGPSNFSTGEIAVFKLDNFDLKCRVVNKPYDIFGAWYNEQYLLSGDLHWLTHCFSSSHLWLNKTSQEIQSASVPVTHCLYKFFNRSASAIRNIIIANCPSIINNNNNNNNNESTCQETIVCYLEYPETPKVLNYNIDILDCEDLPCPFWHNFIYTKKTKNSEENLKTETYKYLIFATGDKTFIPHQIAIKKVDPFVFPEKIDPGLTLKERLEILEARREQREQMRLDNVILELPDFEKVAAKCDKVDYLIDLHGHVVGMKLSPDHRYLYVNCRPWPDNYTINNPLEPPPVSKKIVVHVVDLATVKHVGSTSVSADCQNRNYSSNNDGYLVFLDVSKEFVASGAGDNNCYLWDRRYGACLAKLPHRDIVNAVALNPADPEMLVTVSDDHTVKIWRSKVQVKKMDLNINLFQQQQGTEFRNFTC